MIAIPYYSQWESPELAGKILAGELALRDDPAWRRSGAVSPDEYARWADHICGMACLKMILAARTGEVHPTLHLARIAREYGAYVEEGDAIRGLIYAPFVAMLGERFRIDAEVVTGIAAAGISPLLQGTGLFIASVHPTIRLPDAPPPKKGGHLVLVTSSSEASVSFHNPSGHEKETQEHCRVPVAVFDRYFAGRGVLVRGQETQRAGQQAG
jgi:hypothetical protein